MREADFDSAIALYNHMPPELRAIDQIFLLRDYYAANEQSRAALLQDVRTGNRQRVLMAASMAATNGDLETARLLADALPAPQPGPALQRAAMLAQLEVARGRTTAAQRYAAEMERLNRDAERTFRGGCALLPFFAISPAELRSLRAAFEQADSSIGPGTDDYSPAVLAPVHRLYMLGALSARLGEINAARRYAARVQAAAVPATWRSYAGSLAQSLESRIAVAEDRPDEALRLLERIDVMPMDTWDTPLDADRYMRIDLLLRAGRADEALQWIDNGFDVTTSLLVSPAFVYRAVRELRRAEAHEQRGDRANAIAAYTRFLELWRDADPAYAAVIQHAQQRRAALLARSG